MRNYNITLFSKFLNKNFECSIWGHSGKPFIVFPTSCGRYYDYKNFGMVEAIKEFIEEGYIKLYCVDSIDKDSWFSDLPPAQKAYNANLYDAAIVNELVPIILNDGHEGSGIGLTGCSFGAYYSAQFLLRHPHIFDLAICLSGIYSIKFAIGDFINDDIYYNDPLMYLPNLLEEKYLNALKNDLLILCVGQGAWEDKMVVQTNELAFHLRNKQIPHIVDLWGYDVNHDWYWWKKMIFYFLSRLKEKEMLKNNYRYNAIDCQNFVNFFYNSR